MRRSLSFLLISLLLTASPPVSRAQSCGAAPAPRLSAGQTAHVVVSGTGALNIRDQAARAGARVGGIPEGAEFAVLEGPICADDINWWRVEYDGQSGWIAEAADGEYFVAPGLYSRVIDLSDSSEITAQGDCGTLPSRWENRDTFFEVVPGITLLLPQPFGDDPDPFPFVTNMWVHPYSEPICVRGDLWWEVEGEYIGYVPEILDGEYVLQPFVFDPAPPVALDMPMTEPVVTSPDLPLPTVTPDDGLAIGDFAFFWSWSGSYDPLQIELPASYQGDVLPSLPVDLNTVHFAADAGLSDEQLRLLAQNGFVVVPGGFRHMDNVYYGDGGWPQETGHGDFITTDALLHALFLVYENTLQQLELATLYLSANEWIYASFEAALAQDEALKGTSLEQAARRVLVYYGVAMRLLQPFGLNESPEFRHEQTPPDAQAAIDEIVALIEAGEGVEDLPLFDDYREDFTQYKPRGYYAGNPTLSAYFRAMMWLGRITFRSKSADETAAGLLALRALHTGGGFEQWQDMDETLAWLVGPVDDLSPTELIPLAQSIEAIGTDWSLEGIADPAAITTYTEGLKALPGPRINSLPLPVGILESELDEETRGFRVFGQRFTFDAYVFQSLIYPAVGEQRHSRALPMGEDVAAVLGSDLAFVETEKAGATTYVNYTENVARLRDEVNQISAEGWAENLYGLWLHALQPLAAHSEDALPPMMLTDAWKYKDMNTLLGSLAELKHATLLYAEQATGGLGGGGSFPPVTSYSIVEPNPLVFARIAIITELLPSGLRDRGMLDDFSQRGLHAVMQASATLSNLSARVAEYARRELAGEPLTDEDYYWLQEHFGSTLWMVRYHVEEGNPNPPERMAIVADVASNPSDESIFYMATGDADLIYVVTNSPFGPQLTRGAVYSSYQFEGPLTERLDDDQWRARVAAGDLPPRPTWVATYRAE